MTLFSPTRAFKLLVWCMLIFDDAISIHHSTGLNRGEFSYLFISPFHSSTSVGLTLAFSQVKIQSFYAHQIQFTRLNFLRDENYLFFEISVFQNGHLENRVVGEMKKKRKKKRLDDVWPSSKRNSLRLFQRFFLQTAIRATVFES